MSKDIHHYLYSWKLNTRIADGKALGFQRMRFTPSESGKRVTISSHSLMY